MEKTYNPDTYCYYAFSAYDSNHKWCCCVGDVADLASFQALNASPKIQQIRNDLKNGIKSPDCWRCWKAESVGETSVRMTSLQWISENMPTGNYYDAKLRTLWLDSGTVCNLACRTCSPMWSSSHVREAKDRYGDQWSHTLRIQKTDLDNLLQEDFSALTQIFVIGGETLLNLEHLAVLEKINNDGFAHQVKVTYLTNGTLPIPQRLLDLIPQYKEISFMVSIDGVGTSFEYTRTRANWNQWTANIEHMRNQITGGNANFYFHITVSALNVLNVTDIISWVGTQIGPQHLPMVERVQAIRQQKHMDLLTILHPSYYTFAIFTDEQKIKVRQRLEQSPYDVSMIISALESEGNRYSAQARQQFDQEVAWTHSYHGLSLADYLPELQALLNS